MVFSNNVSILHHFFDTTTFTVYVTACKGGANLEKSFIFWKQLRLKTTDTFPLMYTKNIDNMCNTHWRIGVRKVSNTKVTPRSLKVIDIGAIWQDKYDFPLVFHCNYNYNMPSVLWHCWLGGKKGIQPVKNWAVGAGMVICLEWGADLHMAQQMPLALTVSCFSKIQNGSTFLVPAHLGSQDKGPLNKCVGVHTTELK